MRPRVDAGSEDGEPDCEIQNLAPSDARAGYRSITYQQCLEMNDACERFFRSRNMTYGTYYRDSSQQFYKNHDHQNPPQHAPQAGPVPEVSPEGGPRRSRRRTRHSH